jgi:hypothetical protein
MELDDINAGLASQEAALKKEVAELEKVDDLDIAKDGAETIDHEAEKKLVRKLDFWSVKSCLKMT